VCVCVCVFSTTLMSQTSNQAFWSLNGNSPQSSGFLGTTNDQPLIFKSNSIEGFRLMPNGFLGIGTLNPTATLDVNGNVMLRSNLFVAGNIEFGNSSGFVFPENYILTIPAIELLDYFKVGNSVIITASNHVYTSENSGPLFLQSQKHDQHTLINWNNEGNVGIGTNNPQRKLHVRSETRLTAIPIDTTNFERNSIRIEHELFTGGGDLFSSSAWDISPGFRGKLHFFSANTNNNVLSLYENGNVTINNGRLGVGTDNPQAVLDISGDAILNGKLFANDDIVLGENSKFVFPDNFAVSFTDIELNNLAVGKTILTDDNHIYTEENAGSLYIQSKEYDQNTILNLGNKGKVGIGTDNPQKKLHIKEIRTFEDEQVSHPPIKEILFDSVFFNMSVDERDLIVSQNERRGSISTELQYIGQSGLSIISRWDIEPSAFIEGSGTIGAADPNKLHFKYFNYSTGNHHTVMSLTQSGTVGIGTMSPGARLHVHNGNMAVTNGRIGVGVQNPLAGLHIDDNNLAVTKGKIGVGTVSPNTSLEIRDGTLLVSGGAGLGQESARFVVDTEVSTAHRLLELRNNNGIVLRVNGNGRMGIGVDNPVSKLHVCGTIRSKEWIVENFDCWADFVFDKDYNLMPITERKEWIFKHSHMPYMLSEAKMIENGAPMFETVRGVVQNTEEIYLYLFELDERLNKLEEDNKQLKQENEKLKTSLQNLLNN
jgi:hypothetical protein